MSDKTKFVCKCIFEDYSLTANITYNDHIQDSNYSIFVTGRKSLNLHCFGKVRGSVKNGGKKIGKWGIKQRKTELEKWVPRVNYFLGRTYYNHKIDFNCV